MSANDYPQSVALSDSASVELRIMEAADRDAVLSFARALPEDDLLFLSIDISQPEVVDQWFDNIKGGTTVALAAYDGGQLAGYAAIHRNPTRWTRRVGEIRVNVGPDYRARGLGRHLTAKIFNLAQGLELKKLTANMTAGQVSAQAAFKRLGFMPEAVLADHVEDRSGTVHDMVIMSYDMDGLTDQMDEPLKL